MNLIGGTRPRSGLKVKAVLDTSYYETGTKGERFRIRVNSWAVVNVGVTHDTAELAMESIHRWWTLDGRRNYPAALPLLICTDAGGSNGSRLRRLETTLAAVVRSDRSSDQRLSLSTRNHCLRQCRTPHTGCLCPCPDAGTHRRSPSPDSRGGAMSGPRF